MARREVLVGTAIAGSLVVGGCTDGSIGGFEIGSDERGEIVETYDGGIERLNEGIERRDEGVIAFNDERHGDAVGSLDTASERCEAAAQRFRSAAGLAEESGVPPATRICEEAATHAETMGRSAEAARNGAVAADEGEPADVINDHIEQSRELQAEAEESAVADPEELLDVLEAER